MNVDEELVRSYYNNNDAHIRNVYDYLRTIGYGNITDYYKYEFGIFLNNIHDENFINVLKSKIRKDKLRKLMK